MATKNNSKPKDTKSKTKKSNSLSTKLKEARAKSLQESSKPLSIDENLRPESRLAKIFNKASNKASEVGDKEVSTPTPTKGVLAKRVDPLKPIKWFFRYLKESYIELKKVQWPDRKTAWKLTGTVFMFSVIMALLLFGLDSLFSKMFELVFLKD
ncbi:MAG: Protein translocase subunit SecE [Patescibacteria group bacterium]|nr:Protein translocase subunit SecE [Patescibacteria group bacterium]